MKKPSPYQVCFPIGVLSSLLAVAVWLVTDLHWFDTPVLLIHSRLIAGAFLWSFIAGFLMTAIPKMTDTAAANHFELISVAGLLIIPIFFAWQMDSRWFYGSTILLELFLLVFGARRVLRTKKTLPIFFSHVGLGFILALAGSYFHFNNNSYMGIHLYHVGAILLLVLGIGTRFFSFLSGIPSTFEKSELKGIRVLFHGLGISVAVLLFLAGKGYSLAHLGLSILTLVYLIVVWQVQRPSTRSSALKLSVRVVAAMLPLSFFLTWLLPMYYISWFHLLFIGCFALITYSVATRVILAHGSYSTDLEMSSRSLWALVSLMILSMVFRVCYGLSVGPSRDLHLYLAVAAWIIGILFWIYSFFMRIFKPGALIKPSC